MIKAVYYRTSQHQARNTSKLDYLTPEEALPHLAYDIARIAYKDVGEVESYKITTATADGSLIRAVVTVSNHKEWMIRNYTRKVRTYIALLSKEKTP